MYEAPVPVEVFRDPNQKRCREHALVLQARGIPHRIERSAGLFSLIVAPEFAGTATAELDRYGRENVGWPPPEEGVPKLLSNGVAAAVLYGVALIVAYPLGRRGFLGRDLWEPGLMHAKRVLDGEWWRTFTALTLHSDLAHLGGNVVFGAAFGALASHSLGSGLTWLCALFAGALGNWINAALRDPAHRSVGASTAVFGIIGLMTVFEFLRRRSLSYPLLRRLAPLMGGAVLLGFLGTSGERTDVLAHCTGLFSGGLLGAIASWTRAPDHLDDWSQALLGAGTLMILGLAWVFALGYI